MMDLHDHLEELAGPGAAPTTAEIRADISRGRSALRRRRAIRTAGGAAFAAAGLAAVLSISLTGGGAVGEKTAAPGPASPAAAVQLVAYAGKQPTGFTIDKVPDGWFVQSDDKYTLSIAPNFVRHPGPGVNPSKSPVYDPRNFTGKIAIMLSSKDQHGTPGGTPFTVGKVSGVLAKSERGLDTLPTGKQVPEPVRPDGDYGASAYVKQPNGAYLIVQFWEGLGFTSQQMIELTAGVHVHKDAQQGVG